MPHTDDKDYLDLLAWLKETADAPLEEMAAFFDARIDGYEAHMSPWQQHYPWLAAALPQDIETLLDIGCGTGLDLDCIFARFPALQVTAVDLSTQMLAALRAKHGHRALTLVQADYFAYDFGAGRFDAVVAMETLHHFTKEKKTGLYQSLHRALKPGGVFLECDYIAKTQDIETLLMAEAARRRQRDGIPPDVFIHFDTPLTVEHELQAIRAAGFAQAEVVGYLPGDDHTPLIRAVK